MLLKTLSTLLLFALLVISQPVQAQEVLTLDQAIQIGLEENYGVQLSQNQTQIASNNYTLGNAGFFPSIEASASQDESIEDSEFEAGGDAQTTEGSRSSNTNAGINLNWTIFDGLRMFTSYNRLEELQNISDKEVRLEMELLVSLIIQSYYDITRISEQVSVLENTVDVSQERIGIEETKYDLGSGSEVDLLQARSDLNADRAALLRVQNQLSESKIFLNEYLSRSPSTDFRVTDDIPINRTLSEEELYQKVLTENSELMIARAQQNVADLELRSIRGERFPEISLSSGYVYNRSETGGGFVQFNEATGFSVGITARVNLFNGFDTSRRVQNAKINQKSSRIEEERSQLRIESNFLSLFRTYRNSIELVDLEENNLENAEETLDIALERFRLGSISSLELREAQRTFQTAENRLIEAKFEAKLAETEILQLSGELQSIVME
ncbi:MAG: TolC family protein [Balneolaceae bacterium]